jgi:glutaredoxin
VLPSSPMMTLIRKILGFLILTFDRLFTPAVEVSRTPADQSALDQKLSNWTLYHLEACPFCVKVRRHLKRLGITLPLKEINENPLYHQELMAGGKLDQVPCLRYFDNSGAEKWMYESSEINTFLAGL